MDQAHTTQQSHPVLDLLVQLAFLVSLVGGAIYVWQSHRRATEHEAAKWLDITTAIHDPWVRYDRLSRGDASISLNEEQLLRVERLQAEALALALEQRSEPAFSVIERDPMEYVDLLDKYPRDSVQRQAEVKALSIAWPNIGVMSPADRIELVRMATRCHLREAEAPVTSQTVLDCVRYGARSLGTEKALERLVDRAVLFRPLTAAP
jgi:hypothetical protein